MILFYIHPLTTIIPQEASTTWIKFLPSSSLKHGNISHPSTLHDLQNTISNSSGMEKCTVTTHNTERNIKHQNFIFKVS